MRSLYWPIEQLPGLNEGEAAKLKACHITNTKQLLQKAGTPQLKQVLANQLQVHVKYVKKWVALADLARIPTVGCRYCGLLLHGGIASVSQLSQTPAHRLHQQILRLQVSAMQRRDLCPPVEEIRKWIQQGQSL